MMVLEYLVLCMIEWYYYVVDGCFFGEEVELLEDEVDVVFVQVVEMVGLYVVYFVFFEGD